MVRPTDPSSSPNKDWRARPPQGQRTAGGRYFRRLFFSLLLTGLVVLLVVLMVPGCLPDVRMVGLPIVAQEMTKAVASTLL